MPAQNGKPSEYDSLVRKMQQQMLIVNGEVMQSMYDSYQNIVIRYMQTLETVAQNMENNVKSLISLQKLQSNQLSSKESLDKSVILCAGSGVASSEEKFLNVNNPFAAPAKQQQQ